MTAAPKLAAELAHALDAALQCARHGLYVLPIWSIVDGRCACVAAGSTKVCDAKKPAPGKHPLGKLVPHGLKEATIDEKTIRAWWERFPLANLGVALKRSGLVGFDVDTPQGFAAYAKLEAEHNLQNTARQRSGSGALHALFRDPGFDIRAELDGITLRGKNYIVAAPSLHISGGRYAWEPGRAPWEIDPIALPPALAERMRRRVATTPAKASTAPIDNELQVKRALAWVPKADPAVEGDHGESKLFRVCCKLVHGFHLSNSDALRVILEGYNPRCVPPWGDDEVDEIERKIRDARADCDDPAKFRVEDRPTPSSRTDGPRPGEDDEPTTSTTDGHEVEVPTPHNGDNSPARWIVGLESFLGEEEPSDDDREDWNVRDIVPRGEALLIAGPPKSGKTWAMLDLAIACALGLPWLTHENCVGGPLRVLVLAFEDGLRRLRKRVWELCRARGISPNDAALREHLRISREPLRLPGNEREFAAELKTWKPSIVLIDNLTRVMEGDPNATKDAARFGNMWTRLGTDVGSTVGFLHHTAKIGPLAFGDRNAGDPFELIKGNGDFVAVARHVILMRPIDAPGEKLSDVRMRGNLDLTRESFVLGFDRSREADRWRATISDRGDGDKVRAEIAADRKERVAAEKATELAAEFERRRGIALKILHETGSCSQVALANALGLKSPRSVAPVFASMATAGIVKPDKVRGYVLADRDGAS